MFIARARRRILVLAPVLLAALAAPAAAGGDLLVAPTRVILDGGRGSEVILNNIGAEPATYRISLELKRMQADGTLAEVAEPSAEEQAALDMISYAPRRVTLAPNQPQAIRIAARPPEGAAAGEYRVHMLFRAVHAAKPATAAPAPTAGLRIALTPIYGVTIPVIVRVGNPDAKASIGAAKLVREDGREAVSVELARTGARSVYGEVRVLKAGRDQPVALVRGVAVYKEVGARTVTLPVMPDVAGSVAGPARIQFAELREDGGRVLAEAEVVLK